MTPTGRATFRIDVDNPLCTACRACELACHFHYSGGFGTAKSRILVTLDSDAGTVQIAVHPSCDGCDREIQPLCIKACIPGALRTMP